MEGWLLALFYAISYNGLERLRSLVSMGVLKQIIHGYWGMALVKVLVSQKLHTNFQLCRAQHPQTPRCSRVNCNYKITDLPPLNHNEARFSMWFLVGGTWYHLWMNLAQTKKKEENLQSSSLFIRNISREHR